jgi:predicted dehydrogenase
MSTQEVMKLAIVGGHRGGAFDRALEAFRDRVQLTAICDLSEKVLARWKEHYPDIQTFTSYDELLEKGDCTAVFIATPVRLHAEQAVRALQAGRHVISEVVAATTIDECWQLVETVEKTGLVYMLAENYCYMRPNMMVLNMVQRGVFGELMYAEGAYIHDCRDLLFTDANTLTWRGEYRRGFNGNSYPTHSLGPAAQWMNINRKEGDRLASTATWMTPARATSLYVKDRLGSDHPAARDEFWTLGDSATTVIQTEKGAVILLRVDWASSRPHNMTHYVLQGTQAAYISARRHHEKEEHLIWIDGTSPGDSPKGDAEWESLWKYNAQYEHPYWKEWGERAERAGHGGGDFFILKDFLDAVQTDAGPPIDVYDAVTWSSIVPLSAQSVAQGSAPVEIPRFGRR